MIAPPGEAFKLAMKGVNGARVYVAAMCVGMLGHALETALAYGAERRAFGKSLLEHQGLNWSLGDVANDLEALRGLVAHAGHLIDREEDAVMAAAHAKKFAGRVTLPRLADCIQSIGILRSSLRALIPSSWLGCGSYIFLSSSSWPSLWPSTSSLPLTGDLQAG